MIKKVNGIPLKDIIYHGTVFPFDSIKLTEGREYKDFGKGFYSAFEKTQSIKIVKKKFKNPKYTRGYIYTYDTDFDEFTKLVKQNKVKYFPEADLEWIDFVLRSRTTKGVWHDYSIVIGPTADDDMRFCFDMYRQKEYGPLDSERAKLMLISNLEVENLGIQMYIANTDGLKVLKQATRKMEILRQ